MKILYLILIGAFCFILACGQGGNIDPVGVLGGGETGYGKKAPGDGDGGGGESSSIVGTWRYDEFDYYEVLTFNSDGTFSLSVYEEGTIAFSGDGTYQISGNTLTIYFAEGPVYVFTFSLIGNTLTLFHEGESVTYYRVSQSS